MSRSRLCEWLCAAAAGVFSISINVVMPEERLRAAAILGGVAFAAMALLLVGIMHGWEDALRDWPETIDAFREIAESEEQ